MSIRIPSISLAWIEYLNRLFGMFLGLLVVVTAILAIIHYRRVLLLRLFLPRCRLPVGKGAKWLHRVWSRCRSHFI